MLWRRGNCHCVGSLTTKMSACSEWRHSRGIGGAGGDTKLWFCSESTRGDDKPDSSHPAPTCPPESSPSPPGRFPVLRIVIIKDLGSKRRCAEAFILCVLLRSRPPPPLCRQVQGTALAPYRRHQEFAAEQGPHFWSPMTSVCTPTLTSPTSIINQMPIPEGLTVFSWNFNPCITVN